jgi:TP53 regulating kinase-like protein
MEEKILSSGAEAQIYREGKYVVKKRIKKSYRLKEIDEKIRKTRTKLEKRILKKAGEIIDVPKIIEEDSNDYEIKMEFIPGKKLSEELNKTPLKEQTKIANKIGRTVGKLHKNGIIHGDLTTSNMILHDSKIYLIDFGLSKLAGKIEDKAVDLHLLRQALEAKHFQNYDKLFSEVKKGYSLSNKEEYEKVFERLTAVEKRGRYKRAG